MRRLRPEAHLPRRVTAGLLAALSLLVWPVLASAQAAGTITTVGGGGGDGVAATSVALPGNAGIAVDTAGNLYIADPAQHTIRKVDTAGIITTIAGSAARPGYSGDGGPAAAALLHTPSYLTIDQSGDLYFMDSENGVVRRIDAMAPHTITTVVGNGCAFWYGGCDVALETGQATGITLLSVRALTVKGGNIYIGESYCFNSYCRVGVFKIDGGGIFTRVAGNNAFPSFNANVTDDATAALDAPVIAQGLAVDAAGDLYIADVTDRIRKVNQHTGVITTIAGNRVFGLGAENVPAMQASFWGIASLIFDSGDNLYITDQYWGRVRTLTHATGLVKTIAGTGCLSQPGGPPCPSGSLGTVQGIALSSDARLYISDASNSRVLALNLLNGQIAGAAGNGWQFFSGDGGPAILAQLGRPQGVSSDRQGNIYIADTDNRRIRRIDAATGLISTVAGNGSEGLIGDDGPATSAGFSNGMGGLVVDSAGNIYVADNNNNRIRRIDAATGVISTFAGGGSGGVEANSGGLATNATLGNVLALAVDAFDRIYIADGSMELVYRVDASNIITAIAGRPQLQCDDFDAICLGHGQGPVATDTYLRNPTSVAVDQAGNVYFGEFAARRVRKVDTAGMISTVIDFDQNARLAGLAIDERGNLYVSESAAHVVVMRESASGNISVFAGTGIPGFGGDGGQARSAPLNFPSQLAVAGARLLIADTVNDRIRAVSLPKAATATTLVSNHTPANSGQLVTFTATVAVVPSSTRTPDGTVTFKDGTTPLGTAPLSATGQATLSTSTLAVGAHSITAVYGGSADFSGSTSASLNQTVSNPGNTSAGSNVTATPVAPNGTTPVTIAFGNVTAGGNTTLTTTTTWFPPSPSNFRAGLPPVYYDLHTSATFTGSATVYINYTGQSFIIAPTSLMHLENGVWVNRTVSHNPATKTICASVTSFSPFVVVEENYLQLSVTPSTARRGSMVAIAGAIKNPLPTAQVITVKLATSGTCVPATLMPFPVMLAGNQTRSVSIPLPVLKKACVGTYTLTMTGWIGTTKIGEASATLTVTP